MGLRRGVFLMSEVHLYSLHPPFRTLSLKGEAGLGDNVEDGEHHTPFGMEGAGGSAEEEGVML